MGRLGRGPEHFVRGSDNSKEARAEAVGTFVFVLVGVGSAVGTASLLNSLPGTAMNPARAYGPMIAGGFYPGYWYIYLVAPVIGAILAGLVHRYLIENPT